MTNIVWVLTREENLYDQEGEYFEHVWLQEPSLKDLAAYNEKITHLGRQGVENTWYNLHKVHAN